jgi:hypothetical protein
VFSYYTKNRNTALFKHLFKIIIKRIFVSLKLKKQFFIGIYLWNKNCNENRQCTYINVHGLTCKFSCMFFERNQCLQKTIWILSWSRINWIISLKGGSKLIIFMRGRSINFYRFLVLPCEAYILFLKSLKTIFWLGVLAGVFKLSLCDRQFLVSWTAALE